MRIAHFLLVLCLFKTVCGRGFLLPGETEATYDPTVQRMYKDEWERKLQTMLVTCRECSEKRSSPEYEICQDYCKWADYEETKYGWEMDKCVDGKCQCIERRYSRYTKRVYVKDVGYVVTNNYSFY